ncbi:MBG domain-containing protein, partial [Amaricoccus macauensis]|uniref:MBG domain-containing protein n=1 Tax=Amaricoccus macauensis TaxID=57001 RepID=UPI003C7C56F1
MMSFPKLSGRSLSWSLRLALLAGTSLLALGGTMALADGVSGGKVARGKVTISQKGGNSVIRQQSRRAVIDWDSFDVGRNESVTFDQPGVKASTLNRVNSASRSVIEGAISAPGTVIIQNTAGVLFTGTAKVDVGGLVATSQLVDADLFQSRGDLTFGGGEAADARVINRGELTIGEAGLAALVGRNVRNAGAIVARSGTVALASGERTTIDLSGDGTVQIAVEGEAEGGRVENPGMIDIGNGTVILSAGAASDALDGAINTSGIVRAGSASGGKGLIRIEGRGKARVEVSGTLDASGSDQGGAIEVTGKDIAVTDGARIDASGTEGGTINIGGGFQGRGPLKRADYLTIEDGAVIAADGTSGDGGTIVAWSDGETRVGGALSATGNGAGGLIETSGKKTLTVEETAQVNPGAGGQWLLDPRDVVIGNYSGDVASGVNDPADGSGPSQVSYSALQSTLNSGSDVVITTDANGEPGANEGNISFTRRLSWSGSGALTLQADGGIDLGWTINTTDGDFTAEAGGAIDIDADITSRGTADLSFSAGSGITVTEDVEARGSGDVTLRARGGNVQIGEFSTGNVEVSTNTGALGIHADKGTVVIKRHSATGAAHVEIESDSGPIDITARDKVWIKGATNSASWVRIGNSSSSSDVRIAADVVKVFGGDRNNAFAEVVTGEGGSITVEADRFRLENGTSAIGMIAALNGADLTLNASTQEWDGVMRAGSGASDGGNVTVSGNVDATIKPEFSLAPGRNFSLAPGGSITSSTEFDVTTSGTGTIDVQGNVTAEQIDLVAEQGVSLGPDVTITGTGPGNAIVVAAGASFENLAGGGAFELTDPGARWLLYVDDFDSIAGAVPASGNFDLYGRPYSTTPPQSVAHGGNRVIYGEQPTLTLVASDTGKTYGEEIEPDYEVTGLRPGDTLGNALISGPNVSSDGAEADAEVGEYSIGISATQSSQGYLLSFVPGTLTIDPAQLTVTADDASRTYGAENPDFTASYSGFVLGQDASDLDGTLGFTTAAGIASDVGDYDVAATGLTSGNYEIAYEAGTLTIDPAQLTVTTDDASRTYGAENPDFTASYSGFVLGQDESDLDGTLGFTTAAGLTSDVGDYDVAATGLTSGNYEIAYEAGTLTIDPALLTVTTDDASRTYGAANPEFTASYSGFVLGQDAGDLDGTLGFTTAAGLTSDVGNYDVAATGLTSGNYEIAYEAGTLTIDPA